MVKLAFLDEERRFDGNCVRFMGRAGGRRVCFGVTTFALQYCDRHLPKTGLIPAELFLEAFDRLEAEIQEAARSKFERGEFEDEGEVEVLIHRKDLRP
jgi:hypothetical protein